MSTGYQKLQLGESWVVEGGDDESPRTSAKDEDEDYVPWKASPTRKTTRRSNRSPEPELVMPSLDIESMDGSWADSTSRSSRLRESKVPDGDGRRRNSRMSNGSPVKRTKPKTYKTPSPAPAPTLKSQTTSTDARDVFVLALEHIGIMLNWLLDIIFGAIKLMKKPLSYLLAIWLMFGLLVVARNFLTSSINASLSPLCRIPGAGFLNLPFCPVYRVDNSQGDPPNAEFNELMKVQANFEEVLEASAGGVSLPLDMKRGEASIRDLRQLVRYSHLQSK